MNIRILDEITFIDMIFEFRYENRMTINEDDCFSRNICEILGPPLCLKCNEYINSFEEVDTAFNSNHEIEQGYLI